VKLGHVSVDGSKVKANASRHKAMSYQRLTETETRLKKIRESLGSPGSGSQGKGPSPGGGSA